MSRNLSRDHASEQSHFAPQGREQVTGNNRTCNQGMARRDQTPNISSLFPEKPGDHQPQIRHLSLIYTFPIRTQDVHCSLQSHSVLTSQKHIVNPVLVPPTELFFESFLWNTQLK